MSYWPDLTNNSARAVRKKVRSILVRRFHQGTCWISISMALSLVGWPTLNLLGGGSEELVELRGPLCGAVVRPLRAQVLFLCSFFQPDISYPKFFIYFN